LSFGASKCRPRTARDQTHHQINDGHQGIPVCSHHLAGIELMQMIRKGQMHDDSFAKTAAEQCNVPDM